MEAKFQDSVATVQKLKQRPSNDELLKLYAFYKQSTVGDVSGKRPGFLDLKGRAKFDAWSLIQGTSKQAAMQSYIDLAAALQSRYGIV